MFYLLIAVHVLVCFFLIMVVLLQTGKGAEMGASFGGGSSQTLFGSRGAATFLSKLTTASAIIFMITSLALAVISARRDATTIVPAEPVSSQPAEQTPPPGTTGPVADPGAQPAAIPGPVSEAPAPAPAAETPAPAPPAGDTQPKSE